MHPIGVSCEHLFKVIWDSCVTLQQSCVDQTDQLKHINSDKLRNFHGRVS